MSKNKNDIEETGSDNENLDLGNADFDTNLGDADEVETVASKPTKASKKKVIETQETEAVVSVGKEPCITCIARKDGRFRVGGTTYALVKKKPIKVPQNVYNVMVEAGWA